MTKFFWALLLPQLDEARRFWKNKQIRTALIVPWAEAFTAAFLTPVIPYFMQGLGMTAVNMGQLRTVQLILNGASAPVAGVMLDKYGPFLGIALPSSLCAIGCTLRALAQNYSWLLVASTFSGLSGAKMDMALAHTSRHTPPPARTLAVSAANVQVKALTLIGMLCFTPLNAVLTALLPQSEFGMLRFRLLISLCTIGCGFGVLVLLCASRTLTFDASPAHGHHGEAAADGGGTAAKVVAGNSRDEQPLCNNDSDGAVSVPSPSSSPADDGRGRTPARGVVPPTLLLLLIGLFCGKYLNDTAQLTWPLFIKAQYGWDETEYALLLPMQQALAFALVGAPVVHQRLGSASTIRLLGGIALSGYVLTYAVQQRHPLAYALHVATMLIASVAGLALELVLTAIASTYVSPAYQGRLFAAIAVVRYAGSAAGNLGGAALFQYSQSLAADGSASLLSSGGTLPFTVAFLPTALNLLVLASCAAADTGAGVVAGVAPMAKKQRDDSGEDDLM